MSRPLPLLPKAVFCHAQWRTGSTAIFSAFRADSRFMCFYEPLHKGLRTMTEKKAMRYDADDVRRLGHDGLSKPYFQEYRGVLAHRRGVPAFPSRLSYGEFFNVSVGSRMDLQTYFQLLADFAHYRKKVPVFCLNRSWGRIGAFRDLLPESVHLFSLRNPGDTWESQRVRRSYFFAKLLYIYSRSEPDRTKQYFPEISNLSLLERIRTERTFKRLIAKISDDRIEPLFWRAYATALVNGVVHADFILDLDQTNPGKDDRLALGHYLALLPGRQTDKGLPYRLRALAQREHQAHEVDAHSLPEQSDPELWHDIQPLLQDREDLLLSACRMAPKLSAANRYFLSRIIAYQKSAAC